MYPIALIIKNGLFAAVALSVIDTSSSNFFAENWTQFPHLEELPPLEEEPAEPSDGKKKVNNAAVTVNSNKETATSAVSSSRIAPAATSVWGPKWIANLTDVIGISNRVIKHQSKRKYLLTYLSTLAAKSPLIFPFASQLSAPK